MKPSERILEILYKNAPHYRDRHLELLHEIKAIMDYLDEASAKEKDEMKDVCDKCGKRRRYEEEKINYFRFRISKFSL